MDDPLVAESEKKAIHVSQYGDVAQAVGDLSKDEWIIAEASYGLDWMR